MAIDPNLEEQLVILDQEREGAEEEQKARDLAERLGLEFDPLDEFRVDPDLFQTIPVEVMLRYQFLPLRSEGETLHVVMADPSDVTRLNEVELVLARPLEVAVGPANRIGEILEKSESTQRVLEEATEGFSLQLVQEAEDGEEVLSIDRITADSSPIIRLVDSILFNAIQRRASDIHIETRDREVVVKYRIDGVLYQAMKSIDKRHHSTIISVHGEDAVIRILDKESTNAEFHTLNLEVLGLEDDTKRQLRKFINEPYGMVLVTGPTGSGKTTTLYACLSEIRSSEDKIITIEDPVEYQLEGITQIPVNEKKGLTFARGLRSILRHDPDKVMVGEIRDEETAQIAVQSALTGHLVFTTVHANNVVDVIGRILNMNVDLHNFVSALNCVLAQRLVRRICLQCKRPAQVSDTLLEDSGLEPGRYRDFTFYEGAGCIECNGTGYRGRLAIAELLNLSDNIRQLILDRRSAAEIKRAAKAEGMRFLRESALQKVFAGETSLYDINKVTFVE